MRSCYAVDAPVHMYTQPNCMAKYFTVGGERKIIMSTLREIAMGEELTYDYKFAREVDPNVPRIPCRCGSGESTTAPRPPLMPCHTAQ